MIHILPKQAGKELYPLMVGTSIGSTQVMTTRGIMKAIMVIMMRVTMMPSRVHLVFLSSLYLACVPGTNRPSPSSSFYSHHFSYLSKRISLVFTSRHCLQCLSHVTRRFLDDNLKPTKHISLPCIISYVNIKLTTGPSWLTPTTYC